MLLEDTSSYSLLGTIIGTFIGHWLAVYLWNIGLIL